MAIPVIHIGKGGREAASFWRTHGAAMTRAVPKAAARAAEAVIASIVENELTGGVLNVRSGMLRNSLDHMEVQSATGLTVKIGILKGPAVPYGRIQDQGGVIRPKNGRALAIPIGKALTPTGQPRFPGGPKEAEQKHPDLFLVKRTGRPPLLCYPMRVSGSRKGRVTAIVPLFILAPSVTVKATRWLSGGVRRRLNGTWKAMFNDVLRREVEQ